MKEKTPHELVAEHIIATSDNKKLRLSIISNPEGVVAWIKFNLKDWVILINTSYDAFHQDTDVDLRLVLDELKILLSIHDE